MCGPRRRGSKQVSPQPHLLLLLLLVRQVAAVHGFRVGSLLGGLAAGRLSQPCKILVLPLQELPY